MPFASIARPVIFRKKAEVPDNIASIRVLEKCGFAFLRYEPSLGRNHYEILSPSENADLPSSKD